MYKNPHSDTTYNTKPKPHYLEQAHGFHTQCPKETKSGYKVHEKVVT